MRSTANRRRWAARTCATTSPSTTRTSSPSAIRVNTLRCLYDLSCIPPDERNWKNLLEADGRTVSMEAFEAFCRKNPQLVRRLRDANLIEPPGPKGVVNFLKENEKVPTRYRRAPDSRSLEAPLKQFPVLPPQFLNDENEELTPKNAIGDRGADAVLAARAWYRYAAEPTPPPTYKPIGTVYSDEVRTKYRIPKSPGLIIFLQGAPRAQSYVAERLAKEGWLDADPWDVDEFWDANDPRVLVRRRPRRQARRENRTDDDLAGSVAQGPRHVAGPRPEVRVDVRPHHAGRDGSEGDPVRPLPRHERRDCRGDRPADAERPRQPGDARVLRGAGRPAELPLQPEGHELPDPPLHRGRGDGPGYRRRPQGSLQGGAVPAEAGPGDPAVRARLRTVQEGLAEEAGIPPGRRRKRNRGGQGSGGPLRGCRSAT